MPITAVWTFRDWLRLALRPEQDQLVYGEDLQLDRQAHRRGVVSSAAQTGSLSLRLISSTMYETHRAA